VKGCSWDYLILTASNDIQARAYESQLRLRHKLGLLRGVREALVVADPGGRRVGSGGSTVLCLAEVLRREGGNPEEVLRNLRILIVHAGGDSRRLPAYGPCGKIFVPVPGGETDVVEATLFDILVPPLMALPPGLEGRGQVVVAAGDALLQFDPSTVRFDEPGMIALGCYATPEEASRHGVFCMGTGSAIRLYLQKPSPEEQARTGAIGPCGQTALDIGVMSFDGDAASTLLSTFDSGTIMAHGLDLYREICCAMGEDTTLEHYIAGARGSGSTWEDAALERVYPALRRIPFHIGILPRCGFLHFGSTRQLIESGIALAQLGSDACICIATEVEGAGTITGTRSWVEGCRVRAPLALGGRNVVVGVDVDEHLALPPSACLDVIEGQGKWFYRCYGVDDAFKDDRFLGGPVTEWLAKAGINPEEIGEPGVKRTLWDAKIFPAGHTPAGYRRWLWMFDIDSASLAQKREFVAAERYSVAEVALLADQDAFYARRRRN